MIYGRRVIESHQWLYAKSGPLKSPPVDRKFQWKYTWYLTFALMGSAAVFFVPMVASVLQNYRIFIALADQSQASLVQNLEREVFWLMTFLGISLSGMFALCVFIGFRLTESILGPLISMERHMKKLLYGNLIQKDFQIRASDDFRSLASTYSYLFQSLKAQAEQDLKWLEKISVDPKDQEALWAWQNLIKTKRAQLGLKTDSLTTEYAERNVGSPETRHAS